MLKNLVYVVGLCLVVLGVRAQASTIGPDCGGGNCFGSTYTLSYTATANPDIFDVNLAVDTTGYTGTSTNLLNAVSLKIVPKTSDITSVSLLSSPATFSSTQSGGLSANGCSGNGGGFFCSGSSTNGVAVGGAGDIYNFLWQVQLTSPSDLFLDTNEASVKALYVTSSGNHQGITSADITLDLGTSTVPVTTSQVPEPSSIILLGTGLLGAAAAIRRRLTA